ncbi:MAG: sigma-70 family RNA polymerase sigma factor [Clostridia bacterium]
MDKRVKRVNKLIKEIANGKIQALDSLYGEFGGLLYIMARKYLYDKSLAEDLVSDILLDLVKKAYQFKDDKNGLNWLFKSIHNAAINRNKRQTHFTMENIEDYSNLQDILYDENKCVNNEILADAMYVLDINEKDIIYKKYWEGLTVREIAKIIKKPPSTTQQIIKIALTKMKNKIEIE